MKKSSTIIVLIFLIPIVILTAVFVVASNKDFEQRIAIKEDYIEFDAVLYDKVKFEDIRKITYIDNYNFNGIKDGKGATTHRYFSGECNVDEIGKCRAYIYYKNTSFIVLESDKTILFNLESNIKTEELYEEISKKIKGD